MRQAQIFGFCEKLFLALAPIGWGLLVYLTSWGMLAAYMPCYPLNWFVRAAFGLGLFILLNQQFYRYAAAKFTITFFGYSIPLPPWWSFIVLLFSSIFITIFPQLLDYQLVNSLFGAVIFSSIVEEIISHTLFVKYRFTGFSLVGWSLLNSFAFMLMHRWYANPVKTFNDLWDAGHFDFGLLLALIAYKTRRIEVVIILHMLSNLLRYTIPFLVVGKQYVPHFYYPLMTSFYIFCLIGLSHQARNKEEATV